MFRSFIYVNTEKVYEYYSLLDPSIKEKAISKEKSTTNKAEISKSPIGFEHSKTETMKSEVSQYFLLDYNNFERALTKLNGENYFDLVDSDNDYDISTIPQSSIGKIQNNFCVPEEFDYIELTNLFKPLLKQSLNIEESEQELYDAFLGDTKADIPILIKHEDSTVFGTLDTRYLNEPYNQLEEYTTDEVTILFKAVSHNSSDKIKIFDPFKDFIKFNRAMRRSMDIESSYTKEFSPIIVDGPVVKVEILAIYK
ncbi:DUF6414 family protein [Saccharibacillus endophyticus]|uniref:Uncharacterized protein n=1 Tax=Saccharibacillus endophyticus TaxID=2060666 RepID=A0ABQ1ZLB3_9BACL|nr:hypothetical protein [Saccharibacillus endophyticus]GGH68082.1 hypothetical protein GCM10007362_01730 [Saccharibacillus endophyticus]